MCELTVTSGECMPVSAGEGRGIGFWISGVLACHGPAEAIRYVPAPAGEPRAEEVHQKP